MEVFKIGVEGCKFPDHIDPMENCISAELIEEQSVFGVNREGGGTDYDGQKEKRSG